MRRYSGLSLPSPLWLNPFHVLGLLTTHRDPTMHSYNSFGGFTPQPQVYYQSGQGYYVGHAVLYGGGSQDQPGDAISGVVEFYGVSALAVIGLCFYYMLTRYRRTVRGGRPLGETPK